MAHEMWSAEKFAALKAMRAEGMKIDAIAAFLGMTRGSVTGKLHRAGLCDRRLPPFYGNPRLHRGKRLRYWTRLRGWNGWYLSVPQDMTLH
jgi:hypothetical protein